MSPEFEAITTRQRQDALIAALRSGEYKQTREKLRNGDAFCCLGVACNLTGREWKGNFFGERERFMPVFVQRFYGFYSAQGAKIDGDFVSLAQLNDRGKTFAEIADLLEPEDSAYWTRAKPEPKEQ